MEWKIVDSRLILLDGLEVTVVPSFVIWKAQFKGLTEYEGLHFSKPSDDLPNISFDNASFQSSLRACIFVPSLNNKEKKAFLSIIATDPSFNEYEIDTLPDDQIVYDSKWLLFEHTEVLSLKTFLEDTIPGPVSFKELARLYSIDSYLIEIIENDDRCVLVPQISVPTQNMTVTLYPYQETGVNWLSSVVAEGAGGILADEMGLGKTFQIIALLLSEKDFGTSLVIAPSSLLENWKREIERFAPSLKIWVQRGSNRMYFWKDMLKYDVIITSYDLASEYDHAIYTQHTWNLLVLDEAQAIKNSGTRRSQHIREIAKRSGIAVSGTPFENHLTDIWSLFDFSCRGLLGSLPLFKSVYPDTELSAESLERIISPLLLRRKVADVKKDLPMKIIIPVPLEMGFSEAQEYERYRLKFSTARGKTSLGAITYLREFCSHPALLDKAKLSANPEKDSVKFQRLIEILDDIFSQGEKVIIFSGWVFLQGMILKMVENRYCSYVTVLNGKMPIPERQKTVDHFSKKNGFAVLIINPRVGGTGLNITAANHVIHYSPEWNPAVEDQASARVLRIGQELPVTIHRLFYINTIEEVIDERLNRKRDLDGRVIVGTDGEEIADIQRALQLSPLARGGVF